eukprot:CAMPEP_0184656030 /NCGR_PEP_ID=MMETSP0308-20130426/15392_1 /TAXON_ID=38269 /ORGANISM="Gloeochaete witrockiana, Strain SAG 46.84" /LENGTH=372 /DNA_ID=CAMNT_0027092929 /DNA_START=17 /DNA_END=1135 /DNA_ORIENTATION=-
MAAMFSAKLVQAGNLRVVLSSSASQFRRGYAIAGPINVGIIGAGRIGRVHAETLSGNKDAKALIITDVIEAAASKAAADFKIPAHSGNYKDIINNKDIHAVWICSPSDTHAPIIKEAALAGKHIFCEKPVATDLKGTEEALAVVKKCGVKMFLAFQRRFDPNFARIKKAIVSGEIGKLVSVRLCSRDPAPPPVEYVLQSGGIFKDMAIHDLDMGRFLAGGNAVEVYAIGANVVDPRIAHLDAPLKYDTALTVVKFDNGVTVYIDNCRKAVYGYDQRAEAFGTEGVAMSENNYPNNVHHWTKSTVQRDLPLNFFMERYMDAYRNETTAFVNALLKDEPIISTGEDGLAALILAMAAGKSAIEGRPVKISEITA